MAFITRVILCVYGSVSLTDHGLLEVRDWCNLSTVSWYTVGAQFVPVQWLTVAGQAISLSGLSFLVVTAFPRRLDESQPRVAVICCLAAE